MFFFLASTHLRSRDVIEPGCRDWRGRDACSSPRHMRRDGSLEAVRSARFPEKPSRLTAISLFHDLETALWCWGERGSVEQIYLAELVDPGAAQHTGDLLLLETWDEGAHTERACADRYWSNEPPFVKAADRAPKMEFITSSPVRILMRMALPTAAGEVRRPQLHVAYDRVGGPSTLM